MEINKIILLSELIENVVSTDDEFDLYLPKNLELLDQFTPCLLVKNISDDEIKLDNVIYSYSLGMYNIKDIIDNIKQQVKCPTIENQIDAIKYFLENDAFEDFSKK